MQPAEALRVGRGRIQLIEVGYFLVGGVLTQPYLIEGLTLNCGLSTPVTFGCGAVRTGSGQSGSVPFRRQLHLIENLSFRKPGFKLKVTAWR